MPCQIQLVSCNLHSYTWNWPEVRPEFGDSYSCSDVIFLVKLETDLRIHHGSILETQGCFWSLILSLWISGKVSDKMTTSLCIFFLFWTMVHSWLNHDQNHNHTMVQNSQEYRLKYWVTRLSVRSFARTTHSFACSRLLALLTPSAALTHSLARSLRSWDID